MFGSTNVKVNRHPVTFFLWSAEICIVFRVNVAKIIPAASCPLRHCVCFALCVGSAFWTFAVYPAFDSCKGAFACSCRLVSFYCRKFKRKLVFWHWNCSAARAVNERNRFSPVSLAAENPVAQLVIYSLVPDFLFFKEFEHFFNCVFFVESV